MIHTERINADGRLVARPYGEKGMGLLFLNEDGRMICVLCEGTENPASSELREYNSYCCLLYTSPSPRDLSTSRMPSSA